MKKLRIIIFICTAVISITGLPASYLNAQGHIDLLFWKKKDGLQGTASLMFILQKGQTDVISMETSASLGYLKGKTEIMLAGSISYGESFDITYSQKNYLQFTGGYKLGRSFALEFHVFREHDKFEYLKERYWFGGGIKMHFIKSSDAKKPAPFELTGGTALLYEIEQFYDSDFSTVPGTIKFLKFASIVSFVWNLKKNFSLSSTSYFLFALKSFKENDIHTTLKITTSLGKVLSFNTSLTYSYDNTVPTAALDKYSAALTSGLTIKF